MCGLYASLHLHMFMLFPGGSCYLYSFGIRNLSVVRKGVIKGRQCLWQSHDRAYVLVASKTGLSETRKAGRYASRPIGMMVNRYAKSSCRKRRL